MKHLFILNSFAGTKDSTPELEAQIKTLPKELDIAVEYTKGKGDATEIARRYAASLEPLRVYACGGDGTANEAMHGLLGFENAALGLIPVGTGNDYVRALPAPTEDFLDLKKMTEGDSILVDVLKCGDIHALNVISAGYDCEVADRAQKNKRWPLMSGSFAYKLAIVQCLFTKRKHTFTPYADGVRIPLKAGYKTQMLAVAAKGQYYGGGIKATPMAKLDDGLIDYMSIPTVPVRKFATLLGSFTRGEHIDNPKAPFITHNKCRELRLDNGGALKLGVDGEMVVMDDPTITVVEKAIRILIPKNTK